MSSDDDEAIFVFNDHTPLPEFLVGNCLTVLSTLPDESVDCCVTSPPYFGLRDYQTGSWHGGDPSCTHSVGRGSNVKQTKPPGADLYPVSSHRGGNAHICPRCGARRVDEQIGLEESPEAYVDSLVAVFAQVRRVLKDTGSLWLNIGDSYAASGGAHGNRADNQTGVGAKRTHLAGAGDQEPRQAPSGLKPKDLIGIPWRLAFALQADGWYLRSDIIWHKPNTLPECLDPSTKVFVRDDQQRIRQISLGVLHDNAATYQEILTPTGWRKIVAVWETEKKQACVFDAASVETVACSLEHRWPVTHDKRGATVHDLPTAAISDSGYSNYLHYHTIDSLLGEPTITTYLGQVLDYDIGYLVGVYAAEGGFGETRGTRSEITMHADENPIIERIAAILTSRFGVSHIARRFRSNFQHIRFSNAEWMTFAQSLVSGSCATKTLNISLVLNMPRDFRQGIWDGYIAGDGSPRPTDGAFLAASASEGLRDSMTTLASSVGIITSTAQSARFDKRTGKTYKAFHLWTPYPNRSRQHVSGAQHLPMRRKEIVQGKFRMIDVQVDGHYFLINNGLVTHNSVKDRPTSSHEHVFLLTKQPYYYYDAAAIAEPVAAETESRYAYAFGGAKAEMLGDMGIRTRHVGFKEAPKTRNSRNVWSIPVRPYREAHFAVMPADLASKCVKAGSSEKGCCSYCGKPWQRKDTEWVPTCVCPSHEPTPAVILDPFGGAGTTGLVAHRLGRKAILVELNPRYAELARTRVENDKFLL